MVKRYLGYLPSHWSSRRPRRRPPPPPRTRSPRELVPADENKPFDIRLLLDTVVDADSFLRGARPLGQGADRRLRPAGRAGGGDRRQPAQGQGRGARSSTRPTRRPASSGTCNAFNVPLLFLADVPGFMIGTAVERQGIIRHGAKMISAVSEATVPKISVIVRKAYGAGLYAMAGPAFDPDCCLALPTASIAVMGPEAAINAVFYNRAPGDRGPRGSALGAPRSCGASTPRTSTSCTWRPSWWWTRSCSPRTSAPS